MSASLELSAASKAKIDEWLTKFPPDRKRSAVMPALSIVQEENNGYLTEDLMDAVANYLSIPKIAVYEVATFYSMYELKPVGRHKLGVCTSITCMLRGSDEIVDHLTNKLDVDINEVTKDNKFTIKKVECLGACRHAPVIHIGNRYYENLSIDKVDDILASLE